MATGEVFEVLVIGTGPAGHQAALTAARGGRRTVIIEREAAIGGACVHRGTIPSKALRESALQVVRLRRGANIFDGKVGAGIEMSRLLGRVDHVIKSHAATMAEHLRRADVTVVKGRARFVEPGAIEVESRDGDRRRLSAGTIIVATGSRPRSPSNLTIDHENVFDSDSILSMIYVPGSLAVLGGGVIASEYASVFALLGADVTMLDKADRPLKFLDAELVGRFTKELESNGGRYLGGESVASLEPDGVASVDVKLTSGKTLKVDKVLFALGREANVAGLGLDVIGLRPNDRGVIEVDAHCATKAPGVYAVGDVIGPPALASSSMEQGRRAVLHALGLPPGSAPETIPVGVYTIPEMSSVGLSEEDAAKKGMKTMIGRARFDEVARGHIAGIDDGLLKLVADERGRKLLGAQIIGEGATEIIHMAQLALVAGADVDVFVDNILNFPTLAEAYRAAALDIVFSRPR